MIYVHLFTEFFKIGLFSFGGGHATIPFLYHIADTYNWYTPSELVQMIAVASVTPGPVGLNMATYAGIKTAGIPGAILATISEVLPALLLVLIMARVFTKYKKTFYLRSLLQTLKPICCALLLYVLTKLAIQNLYGTKSIVILLILLCLSFKIGKKPVLYILISALMGLLFVFA